MVCSIDEIKECTLINLVKFNVPKLKICFRTLSVNMLRTIFNNICQDIACYFWKGIPVSSKQFSSIIGLIVFNSNITASSISKISLSKLLRVILFAEIMMIEFYVTKIKIHNPQTRMVSLWKKLLIFIIKYIGRKIHM